MKILFIGCVESSVALLEMLLKQKKCICGIVTKSRSSFNADFFDLSEISIQHNIPYMYYEKNETEMNNFIKDCSPDLIYCFGWSHLLSDEIIRIPKLTTIGFHPAALPYNRGRHPIIWALVLGLRKTASSFFYIEGGIDTGDILSQVFIPINEDDTARTLYDKIISVAKKQIIEFTNEFENGRMPRNKQDDLISNIWRKRTSKDGCIDFRMGAKTVYNLVRALTRPYCGAHFVCDEKEYKIWRTEVIEQEDSMYDNIEFGKVIAVYSPTSFLIKTGSGLLKILECDMIKLTQGDYL